MYLHLFPFLPSFLPSLPPSFSSTPNPPLSLSLFLVFDRVSFTPSSPPFIQSIRPPFWYQPLPSFELEEFKKIFSVSRGAPFAASSPPPTLSPRQEVGDDPVALIDWRAV